MKSELAIIDGIYDIQPPVQATFSNIEILLIFCVLITLLSLVIYIAWKTFNSDRNRVRRKIIQLKTSCSEKTVTPHETVYLLCAFLRQGLGVTYLGNNTALPGKISTYQSRWSTFTSKLDSLRYQPNINPETELDNLFAESLFWLRTWP